MPPDFIPVGSQPSPRPQSTQRWSTDDESRSYLWFLIAQFAQSILKKAVEQLANARKDAQQGVVDTTSTYKDRATGELSPDISEFTKSSKTPLQIEVEAIIQRYQQHNLKIPNLASSLKPASEDFSQIIENATGRRSPARPTLIKVDPRSFDFADLLIFAIDRGYGARITSGLGGRHGVMSFHTDGRAEDLTTGAIPDKDPRFVIKALSKDEITAMRRAFASVGVRCYDETDRRNWTPETTGYHLHFDTGTAAEVIERQRVSRSGGTRSDLGMGSSRPTDRVRRRCVDQQTTSPLHVTSCSPSRCNSW